MILQSITNLAFLIRITGLLFMVSHHRFNLGMNFGLAQVVGHSLVTGADPAVRIASGE